jgi:hypothetical protein
MIKTVAAIFIICVMFFSCGKSEKDYSVKRFASIKEIAYFITDAVNRGDENAVQNAMIPKDYYVNIVYPNTTEGKTSGAISGDDFWRIIIARRRPYVIAHNISKYKGRIISIVAVGNARDIQKHGRFRYHRHVTLKMKIKSREGDVKTIMDDDIIGVVVENNNNEFMYMNMLK